MKGTILVGHVLDRLKEIPDCSIQCVVTSPPYWGLRDYGTAQYEGGDPEHIHDRKGARNGRGGSGAPGKQTAGAFPSDVPVDVCSCGAVRIDHQLGLEATPEEYVSKMVAVFREVRRVLKKDGICWMNMGDCYAGSGRGGNTSDTSGLEGTTESQEKSRHARGSIKPTLLHAATIGAGVIGRAWTPPPAGLKQKDLVGMPWMIAFALRADGWWLRQDIIWAKPNPMPESVQDRCTKAHEYLFMLTKSARYYYDAEAIKEPASMESAARRDRDDCRDKPGWSEAYQGNPPRGLAGNGKGARIDKQRGNSRRHAGFNDRWDAMEKAEQCSGVRNKRSVWEIATQPYSEAHFATYPEALVEPCILAGSKPGDTIFDPFCGSGTTGAVALRYHRNFVGIELNPEYARLAEKRIGDEAPMFNDVSVLGSGSVYP